MDVWAVYSTVTKFGLYLGALGCAGLVFNAALFRAQIEFRSVVRLILVYATLGLVAAVVNFGLRGAALMGEWSGAFDTEILSILWETPVGAALTLRIVGFAIVILSLLMGKHAIWPACVGALVILWSFTQIGHVSDKGAMWLQVTLLMHLVLAAFWLGVLTPLRRLSCDPSTLQVAAILGHSFGRAALCAIPFLLIAGGVLTFQLVGGLSGILTPYGLILVGKLGGVAMLLGLGAANKLRFVPRLQSGDTAAGRHLTQSISLECMVFVIVLAFTAFLTSTVSVPE